MKRRLSEFESIKNFFRKMQGTEKIVKGFTEKKLIKILFLVKNI